MRAQRSSFKDNELIEEADELLTGGDQEHIKVITQESKKYNVSFLLLLSRAEAQLMLSYMIRTQVVDKTN